MTLEEFRKNIKVKVDNDLIKQIVLDFVNSNQDFYNPQKGLMTLYKIDENNKGKIESSDIEAFKSQLQIDMLRDRYGGKENFFNVPEEDRAIDGKELREFIDKLMYKYEVSLDKEGIFNNSSLKYEHVIMIKVKPSDYMEFLNVLYKGLRDEEIDNAFLLVESPRVVKYGYEVPIKINCASSSLPKVIDMLNGLEYRLTSKALPVIPLYNRTGTWYGYDQYSSLLNDTATEIFTSIIFEGVYIAIIDYVNSSDNMMIDGMSAREYFERNSSTTDPRVVIKAMKKIVKQSIEENRALMSNIIITTKNLLKERNIDLNDVLSIPTIVENMNIQYGILDTQEKALNEPIIFPLNEVKISYDNPDPSLEGILKDVENMREVLDKETRESIDREVSEEVSIARDTGILTGEPKNENTLKPEDISESSEEDVLRIARNSSHDGIDSLEEELDTDKHTSELLVNDEADMEESKLEERPVDEELKKDLLESGLGEISSDYFARFADEINMAIEENERKKEVREEIVTDEESIFTFEEKQDKENAAKKEILEEYKKYEDFLDFYNFALLGDKIKDSDKTLYEYLEEEKVMSLYEPDTNFILVDGVKITWKEFINNHVVDMVMQAGYFTIKDLIEMSLISDEPVEKVKETKRAFRIPFRKKR